MQSTEETKEYIANLFKARFPILYIQTWEENRVINTIKEIAFNKEVIKTPRKIYIWSLSQGLINYENNEFIKDGSVDCATAINYVDKLDEDIILILKDIHVYFNETLPNHGTISRLRDVAESFTDSDNLKNIVIISPLLSIPQELQKDVTVIDFSLPNIDELTECLENFIADNSEQVNINLSEEEKHTFAKTALGLTIHEAENAFARALVQNKKLTMDELDIIISEKCQIIKKTGILEYIQTDLSIEDVGGLENLKKWLRKRNKAWSEKAQKDYNLPSPKGCLITGIPGTGKSLTAKAMSSLWKLPLLRLDMGKVYNKWLGNSEENIRKAIMTAEAVAPSILWVDEIEKGFAQSLGDNSSSQRILATFLTWLQEKTKPVFVVATANNIDMLPPELMRKGRLDEIFYVDLPSSEERADIFKLHINKMIKNSISKDFKITEGLLLKLVELSEGFSGSEIEQAVISAVFEAFYEDRILQKEDIISAIKNTIPLSVTQSEQIEKIQQWAKERAVNASKKDG